MFLSKDQLLNSYKAVLSKTCTDFNPKSLHITEMLRSRKEKTSMEEYTHEMLNKMITANTIGLGKVIIPTIGTVMGDMLDTFSGAANFDWNSNPAASDGEVIACEMIRNLVGLEDTFSIAKEGLGKFMPHINEALLLCYHSTTYSRNLEEGHKLVVYGVDDPLLNKPFLIRNCNHIRETLFSDSLSIKADLLKLQKMIDNDRNDGLIPHFLLFRVKEVGDFFENQYKKVKALSIQNSLHLFLDFSIVGSQILQPNICNNIDAEFILFDFSELSYLSSSVLFLKDRINYEKKIVNPPQEYLKHPPEKLIQEIVQKATCVEFNSYDFIIGFSNYVSWQRFLFYVTSQGKKGIKAALLLQSKNVNLIYELLSKADFIQELCSLNNSVVAKLKVNAHTLAKQFSLSHKCQPFETFAHYPNLTVFHAPMHYKLESSQIIDLVQKIEEITTSGLE